MAGHAVGWLLLVVPVLAVVVGLGVGVDPAVIAGARRRPHGPAGEEAP